MPCFSTSAIKSRRRKPCQGGLGKVRILAEKVLRLRPHVGEVAAAAAGDQNLPPHALAVFQQQHAPSALAGLERAHHSRRACAEHHHVILHRRHLSLHSLGQGRVEGCSLVKHHLPPLVAPHPERTAQRTDRFAVWFSPAHYKYVTSATPSPISSHSKVSHRHTNFLLDLQEMQGSPPWCRPSPSAQTRGTPPPAMPPRALDPCARN